jgi:hypothetical protein
MLEVVLNLAGGMAVLIGPGAFVVENHAARQGRKSQTGEKQK